MSLILAKLSTKQSVIFFLGKTLQHRHRLISNILGIKVGSYPFIYLGVPIFKGKPLAIYFQGIADKIISQLSSWKGSQLSAAGRLQLLKSVVASMHALHQIEAFTA